MSVNRINSVFEPAYTAGSMGREEAAPIKIANRALVTRFDGLRELVVIIANDDRGNADDQATPRSKQAVTTSKNRHGYDTF